LKSLLDRGLIARAKNDAHPFHHFTPWKPPGLHVTYNPLQEDCAHGRVSIETETSLRARLKARQQREDSQSKL